MPIPNQTITVLDPGLGIVEQSDTVPLYMGCSSSGTVDTMYSFSRKKDAIDTLGQGPLVEAVCKALDKAGGPVLAMRLAGGVVGASGSVTAAPTGTGTGTVTVANAPFDRYEVIVDIVATGTLGTGTFKYSLDDGRTYSEVITIPSGGTFDVPNSNLELTFVPGAGAVFYEAGDRHSFDTTAPYPNATNLGDGFTAVLASLLSFDFIVLVGKPADASAGATIFAALATHLASLESNFRWVRAMMNAGVDATGDVITGYAASANARVMVCYDDYDVASSKPFSGFGAPKQPLEVAYGARAAAVLISTDLGRFPDGPFLGSLEISHDERVNEVLDQHKIATARTYIGFPGFYPTHGRLKSPAGSDFVYWQYGRVMDVACRTVYEAQQPFLNTGVRVNSDGTINDKDAKKIEEFVSDALKAALSDPKNAEGTQGHVSRTAEDDGFRYSIDRTNNVQTSFTLIGTVAVRPLGYVKFLNTQIGFATNLGG